MAKNQKAAKPVKKSTTPSTAKKAVKPVVSKNAKPQAKPAAKKAVPAKKTVAAKAAPAKKAAPKKVVKPAPAKKSIASKTNIKSKNTNKTVSKTTKNAPAKKAAPKAAVKAAPAKKAPAKKVDIKKAPVKAAPKAAAKPAPKAAAKPAPKAPAKPVAKKAAPAPAPKAPVKKEAPKAAAPAPVKAAAPVKPAKEPKVKKPAGPSAAAIARVKAGLLGKANKPAPTPTPMPSRLARDEKKSNVIIAHRKLESKSKTTTPGKTMVSYQPETYRSILDEPAQQQGPVYRYSDEELNEFRALIVGRLEAARKEMTYLSGLITRKDEAGTEDTENRYMNMEDGSGAMEREQLAQLASRQIQFISHLEKALVRIENKTYGICRVTGKLIEKARLRAVPHATLSIEAKKFMTNKQQQ